MISVWQEDTDGSFIEWISSISETAPGGEVSFRRSTPQFGSTRSVATYVVFLSLAGSTSVSCVSVLCFWPLISSSTKSDSLIPS